MREKSFAVKATSRIFLVVLILIPILLDDQIEIGRGSSGSGYGTYPTDSGGELTVKPDAGLSGVPSLNDSKTKAVGDTSGTSQTFYII